MLVDDMKYRFKSNNVKRPLERGGSMERVSTGIKGFDELMEGGIPKGFIIEVSGTAGTGKTLLCMQFLLKAAEKGKKCLYITLDQPVESIIAGAKQFWPKIDKLTDTLKVIRVYYPEVLFDRKKEASVRLIAKAQLNPKAFETLDKELKSFGPELIVVDSLSALSDVLAYDGSPKREVIAELIEFLRSKKKTVLVVSELSEDAKQLSRDGISEFIVDGIIVLYYLGLGARSTRTIAIRKMRETNHGKDVYPMEITKDGIIVKKSEEAYKV